jgi:regulator of cell morphogenesis and NO signaling
MLFDARIVVMSSKVACRKDGGARLMKVLGQHGEAHPETWTVESLVRRLTEDLAPHMRKEEQVLFPYIVALEEAALRGGPRPSSCFGSARNPIRMMMAEHDAVGEILAELRAATSGYTLPADACDSFRALYAGLQELENDLRRHIQLENDVLFPGAIRLEERGVTERP